MLILILWILSDEVSCAFKFEVLFLFLVPTVSAVVFRLIANMSETKSISAATHLAKVDRFILPLRTKMLSMRA